MPSHSIGVRRRVEPSKFCVSFAGRFFKLRLEMQPTTPECPPFSERCFLWLEKTLQERKNPTGAAAKFSRSVRRGLTISTAAYFVFLMVLLASLGWRGERNWLLSVLLFVPTTVWLVPLFLLAPLHLIFRPALCGFTVAAALVIAFVYLDFNWSFSSAKKRDGLVVITSNIGDREFSTLAKFLETEKPDVVALQDGWPSTRLLKAQYPERFISTMGEYVLSSKFLVTKSGMLLLRYQGRAIGAWHEIIYHGQTVVIYNIHMPTPRPEFMKLRGRGFLAEAIGGGGIYSVKTRKSYAEFIAKKIQLSEGLIEVLEKEERPFLVVGDFNMPANGYVWHLFRSRFVDSFGEKGHGYGFTFPSASLNPFTLFGPWLRLDYLFAGENWKPTFCRVEPRHAGQHRAVVAQFELQEPK